MDELTAPQLDQLLFELLHRERPPESALAHVRWADAQSIDDARKLVRQDLRTKQQRGCGTLEQMFPRCVAAWGADHPSETFEALIDLFVASDAYSIWDEQGGPSLEEAFHDFLRDNQAGDEAVREQELLAAVVKALAVDPQPRFRPPAAFQETAEGWVAVGAQPSPTLYAVAGSRILIGSIDVVVAEIVLKLNDPPGLARIHQWNPDGVNAVLRELDALGISPRRSRGGGGLRSVLL